MSIKMTGAWDDVKKDKDMLLKFLKMFGSQYKVGDVFDKDHKAIKYWMDQHGITVDDYKDSDIEPNEKELQTIGKEFKEDDKRVETLYEEKVEDEESQYEDFGDYYIVYLPHSDIKIYKSTLKKFKELYCGSAQMTLAKAGREIGVSRSKLKKIKNAFNITHDSMPFLKEDFKENSIEELIGDELARKQDSFFKEFRQAEYEDALKKLKKYEKKNYYHNKAVNKISESLNEVSYKAPRLYEVGREEHEDKIVVININDWHKGKLVSANNLWGKGGYNKDIYKAMKEKYIQRAIKLIEKENPKKVLILNYGDGPDGPNGSIYDYQMLHQDINSEEQLVGYSTDIKDFILAIHDYIPNIEYRYVPGNHSSGLTNWDAVANVYLSKMLKQYDEIEFDVKKKKHKLVEVMDNRIVMSHGEEFRTGTNTGENDMLNIIHMEELPYKKTYIVHAHLHHERVEGTGYKRIYLPSPIGGDDLSNNMMNTTSRPAQMMFVVTEEGIVDEKHVYFD